MRHPLFHYSLPPSEYLFVAGMGSCLAFLAYVASRAMVMVALHQDVASLGRLAGIAAISGALPLYVLVRRYARQSVARAVGVACGGVLVAVSLFFVDDTLGFIVMLSGTLTIIRHFSAGPES